MTAPRKPSHPKTDAAEAKPLARIVRLGAPRETSASADAPSVEPFRSVEALAVLAGELARFENAKGQAAQGQDTQAPKATVSGLAAMRGSSSSKSPFSLKRDDDAFDADASDKAQATVQPFPGGRSSTRKPEPK